MKKCHGKDLSTNDFTDGYKKKIDSMQTLYRFKGTVDTVNDLSAIENKNIGDTYKCKANSNTYIWNGLEWINAGQDVDYSEILEQIDIYQEEVDTQLTTIKQEGIIVSATEPTTDRRKVWMQKGKNLFNGNFTSGYTLNSTTGKNESSSNYIVTNNFAEVEANTIYTISINSNLEMLANGPRVCEYDENYNMIKCLFNTGLTYTFTTSSNTKYIKFSERFNSANDITTNIQVMLEQNSTATSYEEYIEQKIYILNDNNVYEEFMKKEEKKILSKQVSGNTGEYGNINLGLEISKYIILEMVATAISTISGSLMALRIGSNTTHYAHIITDNNHEVATNADVNITVYYIKI